MTFQSKVILTSLQASKLQRFFENLLLSQDYFTLFAIFQSKVMSIFNNKLASLEAATLFQNSIFPSTNSLSAVSTDVEATDVIKRQFSLVTIIVESTMWMLQNHHHHYCRRRPSPLWSIRSFDGLLFPKRDTSLQIWSQNRRWRKVKQMQPKVGDRSVGKSLE